MDAPTKQEALNRIALMIQRVQLLILELDMDRVLSETLAGIDKDWTAVRGLLDMQ